METLEYGKELENMERNMEKISFSKRQVTCIFFFKQSRLINMYTKESTLIAFGTSWYMATY